ncbi:M23 family metallopeptidase [Aquabacter sp. CN5-332]|uniref:M23 family metallopeptidase n=1 Tax=Aquabacter sp. CN5-332 TaxID=3156608 RepID=UPI0032B39878
MDSAPIGTSYQAAAQPAAPSGPPVAYAPTNYPAYPAPAAAPVHTAVAPPAPRAAGATHVVTGGETLTSIARNYGTTASQLAVTNGLTHEATLRIGQTLIVPQSAGNLAAHPAVAAPKPAQVAVAPVAAPPVVAAPAPKVATPAAPAAKTAAVSAAAPLAAPTAAATPAAQAVAPAAPAKQATAAAAPAAPAKVAAADDADDAPRAAGSGPQFRAPVRGRVISGFGPKPGGTKNDGVNFAVPEGTSVRSAEDGTVAYAGNELKGYGNLVLIKHADGYVTAYAHNSELLVKRGDTVRRGQIVAKAGQSGGVNTPQLHFEIRKGSQPVDPSQYVAGL